MGWLIYLFLGTCFGIVLTQTELISWYRFQEMFRFQSPRMYLIMASAVASAAIAIALIKRLGLKTISGEPISIPPKELESGIRYIIGGTCFGIGWALAGACPGPLFALVGNGMSVMLAAIVSALAGTWVYGLLRPNLPH